MSSRELSFHEWLDKMPFPHQTHEDIIDGYFQNLMYMLNKNKIKINLDEKQFLKYFQHYFYTLSDKHTEFNTYYYNA